MSFFPDFTSFTRRRAAGESGVYRTFPCSSGLKELQTKRRPGVFSRVSTRSWQNPSRGQEKGAETTAKVSAGHPKVAYIASPAFMGQRKEDGKRSC